MDHEWTTIFKIMHQINLTNINEPEMFVGPVYKVSSKHTFIN